MAKSTIIASDSLSEELKEKISQIFKEMASKFQQIFLKGFIHIKSSTIKELQGFKSRLIELGLESLAFYVNTFIKSAEILLCSPKSQIIQSDETDIQSQDKIYQIVSNFNQIITFLRVYERVQTKAILLATIQQQMSAPSIDQTEN
jgi:hypothetical protein